MITTQVQFDAVEGLDSYEGDSMACFYAFVSDKTALAFRWLREESIFEFLTGIISGEYKGTLVTVTPRLFKALERKSKTTCCYYRVVEGYCDCVEERRGDLTS
jgi:hypothetical protein